MGVRGCCCGHLQTLRLAKAGTAIASEGGNMPDAQKWAAHALCSTASTSDTQGTEGQWRSYPGEHGSLPKVSHLLSCHNTTFLCSGLSHISSERRWMNSHPQSSVRKEVPMLRALLFPNNWNNRARSQWTRDYSLLSLWSATSTDLPNILLLQTVHIPEGTK